MGLSISIELQLRGANVTLLSRNFQEAAAHAAAGMLAPQAEGIQDPEFLKLALGSRALYQDWANKLEAIAGLDPGYWPCGILAPVYQRPESTVGSESPETPAYWCDRNTLDQRQPDLGPEVVGAWWFPQDAQVDNRRGLARTLKVAAQKLGVNLREGVEVQRLETQSLEAQTLKPQNSQGQPFEPENSAIHPAMIIKVHTNQGTVTGAHYILATGAWSAQILPTIPVYPVKGQMLSVRVPPSPEPLPLKQVLFGSEAYIVPRRDGLIVIGATVEPHSFDPGLTPAGLQSLLSKAIRLYPALQDFPIQDFWWGFRPTTPDQFPILGGSPFKNLTLAVGHHRNGILLAPMTAQLIADWVLEQKADPLLRQFSWHRFSMG